MAAVKVQFEVGHTSKLRNKKTPEGFTHDWEIYVQGISKSDISIFVDKVVFNLHDSFPKPKRVCKEPPFTIQESGYAGFLMPIDIYFRNRDEPKRFQFTYDLDLQQTGPPHHRFEVKKFIFECPSEEFRLKLVKAGGIPVSGVLSGNSGAIHSATQASTEENTKLMYYDLNIKKHKPRIDDKSNTFSNLFGTPITKNTSTKCSPERKISMSSSHSTTNVSIPEMNLDCTNNTGILTKEKFSKVREKVIGNMEKEKKDKSEKREKHKQTSPYKDSKTEKKSINNGSKYEKRIDEKSKRDKLRDKEKERNRERLGSSSLKRANSSQNLPEVDVKSPKRQSPLLTQVQSIRSFPIGNDNTENTKISKNKLEDEIKAKEGKSKILNSSSSGKKSKREKKDKDKDKEKDREKEKREEHREKYRNIDTKSRDDHIGNSTAAGQVNVVGGSKDIKSAPNSNRNAKKNEKDTKSDIFKTKNFEKPSEKEIIQEKKCFSNNSSIVEKEKKSHKHKKKEKSKDKERDKNKDRLKEKQKLDEILSKKNYEASLPKSAKNKHTEIKSSQRISVTTTVEQSNIHPSILYSENNVNSTTSLSVTKKSHNREKKFKDKTIPDKNLERNILEPENKKNKSLNNTSSSVIFSAKPVKVAVNENLDVSHKNQPKNSPETQQLLILKSFSANTIVNQTSENSNSSSSDLFDNKKMTTNQTDIATLTKKEKKSIVTKTKMRTNEKNVKVDSYNRVEKPDKIQEKDDKKRQRSSTTSNFIEPPVKQFKKEQIAKTTEKSKSPNFRDIAERAGNRETKASLGLALAPITTSDPLLTSNVAANSVLSSMTGTIATSNNLHFKPSISGFLLKSASPTHCVDAPKVTVASTNAMLPNEYLCELQQLHQKIMTLQGNEELQHVVEMIAATGCYEITAKTFDFDLCKLDRNTVQRLQEFLASSVS